MHIIKQTHKNWMQFTDIQLIAPTHTQWLYIRMRENSIHHANCFARKKKLGKTTIVVYCA